MTKPDKLAELRTRMALKYGSGNGIILDRENLGLIYKLLSNYEAELTTLRASLEQAQKELADCKLAYGKLFNENAAMMGRLDELGDL